MLDTITKSIGESVKKTAKKSGEIIEVTKLNIKIAGEKEKVGEMYEEIGKVEYLKYNSGEAVDGSIKELCEQIDEIEANLRIMNRKLNDLKQIKKCCSCNAEVSKESLFCPKCGAKL